MRNSLAMVIVSLLSLGCVGCLSHLVPKPSSLTQSEQVEQAQVMLATASVVSISTDDLLRGPDGGFSTDTTKGSGTVVAESPDGGESLILTAYHLFDLTVIPDSRADKLADQRISITTFVGDDCPARLSAVDPGHDLALLVAACDAGRVMTIAVNDPPRGSSVRSFGNAVDYHAPFMMPFVDGRFVGYGPDPERTGQLLSVYSSPVTPGMSGGPVVHDGELVSVILAFVGPHGFPSLGPPLDSIQNFLKENPPPWQSTPHTSR